MNQVLGIRVTRSGGVAAASSHVVWAGFTETERDSHKQFIREKCHNPQWDGELSLENVEAPVVVDAPGTYRLDNGKFVCIDTVRHREAHGIFLRRNKNGKLVPKLGSVFLCYVTGDGTGVSARHRIVAKANATELH